MRHLDLGVLDGPVLLFGGPYSNAQATEALLAVAADRGIGAERMICTGDIVAYCGAPARTAALIRGAGVTVVAGNCEVQVGSGASDCGCGFEAGSACDLLSNAWYPFAQSQLAADQTSWMAGLPGIATFHHQGKRFAVIHGGVTHVARFLWPTSARADFEEEWEALEEITGEVDHVIAGHCGIPFIRAIGDGSWINAGVIGMPPHDGRQQTRYALLDGGEVTIHRLTYDADAAAADMREAGLPDGYRKALLSGYWPSENVLPPDLRLPSLASG